MAEAIDRVTRFIADNGFKFSTNVEMEGCPFSDRGKYNVDYHLPDYDLYIIVAGPMTMHQVNVLIYLHELEDKNFHLLQMTDENWLRPYDKNKDQSIQKKIEENIVLQFNELLAMKNGEIPVQRISRLSYHRLFNYLAWFNVEREMWDLMTQAKSDEEKHEVFELAVDAAKQRRSINAQKNHRNGTVYMLDEDELKKAAEFRGKHIDMHIKQAQPSLGEWTEYIFCDTGLGVLKKIKCNCCGEELLLTDFDKW